MALFFLKKMKGYYINKGVNSPLKIKTKTSPHDNNSYYHREKSVYLIASSVRQRSLHGVYEGTCRQVEQQLLCTHYPTKPGRVLG